MREVRNIVVGWRIAVTDSKPRTGGNLSVLMLESLLSALIVLASVVVVLPATFAEPTAISFSGKTCDSQKSVT